MFLILPTPSQSVSGVPRSKDDRQSSVSPQRLSHVRLDIFPTQLIVLFVGRAKQQGQGVSHGDIQAEGCYVSQPWQGEGRVTPAPTHLAMLSMPSCIVMLLCHWSATPCRSSRPLPSRRRSRGEGVALIHINSAIGHCLNL